MQNPYTGDIGDYGKYVLLNALAGSNLRLAVVWYLNPFVGNFADGKFTTYLSADQEKHYRHANPSIYDRLKKIVQNGDRHISFVRTEGILPQNTIFYETPLNYSMFGVSADRKKARDEWLSGALQETREAELVFFDPDNGLEVKSHARYSRLGAKYIFENEIRAFWRQGQSLIVYQHLNRSGSLDQQARKGLVRLREFTNGNEGWAVSFHPYTVRLYFVFPMKNHATELWERTKKLEDGPCKKVFGLKLFCT